MINATSLCVELNRRRWLRLSSGATLGAVAGSTYVTTHAEPLGLSSAKRCLLLWLDGGPSHIDTFDPKPEASSNIRGELDVVATSWPGVYFSQHFGKLAQRAKRLAIVRGMSTEEADHGRARICMHTGFRPGQGGLNYPTFGALVAAELGREDSLLPNFVATGVPLGKYDFVTDTGYRGPRYAALVHYDPGQPLANVTPASEPAEFARRRAALAALNSAYAQSHTRPIATGHQAVQERAVRLMGANAASAFELHREPAAQRERYSEHPLGQGCLLARRLLEAGVPFVEVYQGNWDTHEPNVVAEAKALMPVVDHVLATLLDDLAERNLLDETLIVCMGEFGRTPHVNRNGGRDHYAKAWTTLLAGGGIRTGQVIGRTDAQGGAVLEGRVSTRDFFATLCRALGIDPNRQLATPIGRRVGIVDQGGTPIAGLF